MYMRIICFLFFFFEILLYFLENQKLNMKYEYVAFLLVMRK